MITELSDLFTYSSHKREITFTQDVSGRGVCAYPFLGTDEKKMALRARKVSGTFEKRAPAEAKLSAYFHENIHATRE